MKKFFGHLFTIIKHKHLVLKHAIKAGIFFQGLVHDASKFSFTEFSLGVKYYIGIRSPNELEREKIGFSKAWMHHKGRNKHHWEYWIDFSIQEGKYVPVRMPVKYFKEMFCDRVSASKTYLKHNYNDGSPLAYYESKKTKEQMNKDTAHLLEIFLIMLKEEGEAKTFKALKKLNKYEEYIKEEDDAIYK